MIKARKKIRTIIREMFLQSISIQHYSLLSKHSKIHYSETEVGAEVSKFLVVDGENSKWRGAIWQCTSSPPPGRTIKILSAILVRLGWGRLILMSPLALLYPRIPAHRVTLDLPARKTNLCDLKTRSGFERRKTR